MTDDLLQGAALWFPGEGHCGDDTSSSSDKGGTLPANTSAKLMGGGSNSSSHSFSTGSSRFNESKMEVVSWCITDLSSSLAGRIFYRYK